MSTDNTNNTEYEDSWSYDEDDAYVNAPSQMYVEEKAKEVEAGQVAVNLQPTDPPANPKVNDMWIDTSLFPHTLYFWNGTAWQRASVISAEEVGSYTTVQTDELLNNVQLNLDSVEGRTTVVEEAVLPDALVSTITQTETYTTHLNDVVDGKVSTAITDLNVAQYVTQGQLIEKAQEITAKFQSMGGVNLLKNSTGYADLLNWQLMSGSVTKVIGNEMIDSGAGFSIVTGVITQSIFANAGDFYTLTVKVDKGTAGNSWVKLSDGTNFQQRDLIATQAYEYQIVQVAGFVPANGVLIVEFGANGCTGGCTFTAAMLNTGESGLQWSNANGELYNMNVQSDINGLTVFSNVYDGYTVVSPQEFAGYARNQQGNMEKMFTLNKETTEVSRLLVDSEVQDNMEIQMGSMKVKYINGGGYRGWAFIPNT